MPRSPRTKLTLRRERLLKQIAYLQLCLEEKQGELESTDDVIRTRGMFTRPTYFTITDSYGRAKTQPNSANNSFIGYD
jgi:hypothetical protein